MKKLILAGIAVLLVMFFVTCDVGSPEDVLEYTDVEYSEDGSAITVYLDGSKPVPVTRAQRAITTNLAKMAYDYIEVLFVNTDAAGVVTRARSSWELGQSAGISGVDRNGLTGVNYLYNLAGDNDGSNAKPLALMFVGRKDNKTLLGVGRILQVDHFPKVDKPVQFYTASSSVGTSVPAVVGLPMTNPDISAYAGTTTPVSGSSPTLKGDGYQALITDNTTSVTFWIEAVKTGLLIKGETPSTNTLGIAFDSFVSDTAGLASNIRKFATRSSINNSRASYPLYPLPEPLADGSNVGVGNEITATYTFGGGVLTFKNQIMLDGLPEVEKRFPRYMDGGRYLAPQSNVDTETKVELDTTSYLSGYAGSPTALPTPPTYLALNNTVPLNFTLTKLSYGLFSFYIEIPVFLFCRTDPDKVEITKATNGGPDATIWKIRPGLGSELYSLDDGRASGGCVLMGVGVSALDWLEIYWDFVK